MRFVPYQQIASEPNVIVDGAAAPNTVLTLSHWPRSGTPAELRADTSAEIVFRYLADPRIHVAAQAVSNNHFDEDGLVGIFAITNPTIAMEHRELLIDAATAGDFGVYSARHGARIAMALGAFADEEISPLGNEIFELPYGDQAAALYGELLPIMPRLLDRIGDYRDLWEDEESRLTDSEHLLDRGIVTIEEHADVDLAIVRIPEDRPDCHRYALHSRTRCGRVFIVHGSRVEFRYRYESWVQFASRPIAARVDLSELAEELNQREQAGGHWVFDGVDAITPGLRLEGAPASSLPADAIAGRVEHHLRTGRPAWNPYN